MFCIEISELGKYLVHGRLLGEPWAAKSRRDDRTAMGFRTKSDARGLTRQANQSPSLTLATAKSSSPTVTAAFRFRPSFVNVDSPTVDFETIEAVDGRFCRSRVRHLNEGESPRLTRVAVRHDMRSTRPYCANAACNWSSVVP
jgi:hypothetical protein